MEQKKMKRLCLEMIKIDKRIKYHIIVDVETAGGLGNPLVYDIGFAITDKQGRIYETRSFMIEEIFNNVQLMSGAYYSEKVPMYKEDIKNGTREVVKFAEMRIEMLKFMELYNVKIFGAYNSMFDTRALQNTIRYITKDNSVKFLTERFADLEIMCIWCLACQTIYTQKSFRSMALNNGWLTDAGNFRTSAEIGHRFLTGEVDFIESHTGLEDVLIEIGIMAYSYRQNSKLRKEKVFGNPWSIPNNKKYK